MNRIATLALGLLFVTACGGSTPAAGAETTPAAGPALSWSVLAPDNSGFRVEFPGTPQEVHQEIPTDIGPVHATMYQLEMNGGSLAYLVAFNDYPAELIAQSSAEAMLNGARDGAVGNVSGSLVSEERIQIGEFPGRDIVVDVPAQGAKTRARIFLVRNRLYQTVVAGTSTDDLTNANAMHFFQSFQLL